MQNTMGKSANSTDMLFAVNGVITQTFSSSPFPNLSLELVASMILMGVRHFSKQ